MSVEDDDRARPADERRAADRQLACFPATLQRPDGEQRTALIHDLSINGGMLIVRTRLQVDDQISLELCLDADPRSPARTARARVLRVTPLGPEAEGPWTHRVAVAFDEPLSDIEDKVRALAERQRRLGLSP